MTYWYTPGSVIRTTFMAIDLVQLQLGLCLQPLGMDEMAQNGSNNMTLTMK